MVPLVHQSVSNKVPCSAGQKQSQSSMTEVQKRVQKEEFELVAKYYKEALARRQTNIIQNNITNIQNVTNVQNTTVQNNTNIHNTIIANAPAADRGNKKYLN